MKTQSLIFFSILYSPDKDNNAVKIFEISPICNIISGKMLPFKLMCN